MKTSTTFRKTHPLFLILFVLFIVNDGHCAEPQYSSPFSGKYSTTYSFGEKRTFDSLSDLFHFLKDPKIGTKMPKKDEFESDVDFAKRHQTFEEQIQATMGKERTFTIEFKIILDDYSHVLQGFPINLSVFDYKTNVFDTDNDFEANPNTATYRIQGGNVLLSNLWEVDPKKSLYMRTHLGNLSRNIRFRNDAVPLIVHVSDLEAARRLRDNESKLTARIEGKLVDSRKDYLVVTGSIPKSEGWSRSGGTYVARFENLGIHKINITKFVVCLGTDEYDIVTIEKAESIAKNYSGSTKKAIPFYAYKKYERSHYDGYNTNNRDTFFDTGQKIFKDKHGNEHTWRIHAQNYVYIDRYVNGEARYAWSPKVFFECDGKSMEKKWLSSSEQVDIKPIRFIQTKQGNFKYFFMFSFDMGIDNLPVEISEPKNLFDLMGN